METVYVYTRLRKEVGKYPVFSDTKSSLIASIEPDENLSSEYKPIIPSRATYSTRIPLKEFCVSTDKVEMINKSLLHQEGGWPTDVDSTDHQETQRLRKRWEKDPTILNYLRKMLHETVQILQLNAIFDIAEHYFEDEELSTDQYKLSGICVALMRHPANKTSPPEPFIPKLQNYPVYGARYEAALELTHAVTKAPVPSNCVTSLNWQSDSTKFLATYEHGEKLAAILWDMNYSEAFVQTLMSIGTSLNCSKIQPRNSDLIAAGSTSGQLLCYDLRRGSNPVDFSPRDQSHLQTVTDLKWLQSRSSSEVVTTSTDGLVLWWDLRNISEPIDRVILHDGSGTGELRLPGRSLEWLQEAGPTKFLVGTDAGNILSLQRKPKKPIEIQNWIGLESKNGYDPHSGQVLTVQRNLAHVKNFLTVGDWSARIWIEDLKSPIIKIPNRPSLLTGGMWSSTKPNIFFLSSDSGKLEAWDINFRQDEPIWQKQVFQDAIRSMAIHSSGEFIACGDSQGIVEVLQLSTDMYLTDNADKITLGNVLDREARKEKNMDLIRKTNSSGIQQLITYQQRDTKIYLDDVASEDFIAVEEEFYSTLKSSSDQILNQI